MLTIILAYIQLHLVARDLKIDIVQLEQSFINMTQDLRYPIIRFEERMNIRLNGQLVAMN
jgi:hypothetical protein